MAYDKADFYAVYSFYAVDPKTRNRFARFRSPDICGGEQLTCLLHYHPLGIKPFCKIKAEKLVAHFESLGDPLTFEDRVAVIGGAFGWLGEALEDMVPGLESCSLDTSDYVQEVKGESPDDELIESLVAEGHPLDSWGGRYLFDLFSDPTPRSRWPDRVLQNDLSTDPLRQEAMAVFSDQKITRIITEECWQLLPEEERQTYKDAAKELGASMTHIIDGVIV